MGNPGSAQSFQDTITNTGASAQLVRLSTRAFGPDENVQTGSVTLSDSTSPQFVNYGGLANNYGVFHFTVAPGQQRLVGSIAWPGNPAYCLQAACNIGNNSRVRLIFVDPRGRFAAHSLPQGPGNFGSVDVVDPVPGVWTGVIFGDTAANGGTNGTVPWRVATRAGHLVRLGLAVPPPARARAEPDGHRSTRRTPSAPGDAAGSILVSSLGLGDHLDPGDAAQPGRRERGRHIQRRADRR